MLGDFKDLFDHVLANTTPDPAVLYESKYNRDQYYKERLAQRVSDVGKQPPFGHQEEWKEFRTEMLGRSHNLIADHISTVLVDTGGCVSLYNGWHAETGEVDFMTCLPGDRKLPPVKDGHNPYIELDYVDWPPRKDSVWLQDSCPFIEGLALERKIMD